MSVVVVRVCGAWCVRVCERVVVISKLVCACVGARARGEQVCVSKFGVSMLTETQTLS